MTRPDQSPGQLPDSTGEGSARGMRAGHTREGVTGTQSAGRFIRSEADAIGSGWRVWLRVVVGIILFPPVGLAALQSVFAARALRKSDPRAARVRMDQFSDRFRWGVGLAVGV